jgi:acetyltransferase-like isoleucine patch superfamily enzyme
LDWDAVGDTKLVVLGAPWKVRNHLARWVAWPWIRLLFLFAGVPWGRKWKVFGAPILQRHRGSAISIGAGVELRSSRRSNPLTPWQPCVLSTRRPGARIVIGDNCGFTGAVLVAELSIEVGSRVLLGSNTVIMDTDFHPLDFEARARGGEGQVTRPVCIEDDVFVGTQSLILKGVTIGRGAIVGAGSVVTRSVPPFAIVAGNPARVVGSAPTAPSQ